MTRSAPTDRNILVAIVALIVATSVLQFGSTIAAMMFEQVHPMGVSLWRLAIAALVLIPVTRPKVRSWSRDQWLAATWLGLSLGGMNFSFYLAIERIPVGIAVSIEFLGPLLLSAILSRKLRDFLWIGIAFVGMVLLAIDSLVGVDSLDPIGVLFALFAAVFWALYILAGTNAGAKIEGTGGLAIAFGVSVLAALPFGMPHTPALFADWQLIALVVAVGLLGSVIPFTLEYFAMRQVPKPVYGVLTSIEPAVATFFGWLMLQQVAGPLRLGAVALVIAASIGMALGARRVVEIDFDPGPGPATAPITLPVLHSRIQANAEQTRQVIKARTAYRRRVGGIAGSRMRASRAAFLQPGVTTEAIAIIGAAQNRSTSGKRTSSPVSIRRMATVTFQNSTTVQLSGELPAVGSAAPDFALVGTDLAPVKLSDFAGKRVVLNIFPSVDTGVCAASVRNFNEMAAGLDNTAVVCVSQDLPFALGRFCGAEGIENVVSASAFRSSFGTDYGVRQQDGPLEGLLARAVVVIDANGKVTYTELVPEIGQEPDYDAAKAALDN